MTDQPDGLPYLQREVVLVTGPSGAGRSTAIRALEDLGFEVIDNLPLALMKPLLSGGPTDRPLAIGVDVRTRGFSAKALQQVRDWLEDQPSIHPSLLFLDCAPEVLLRRFSETRRKHPLAQDETPGDGIALEIDLLTPLRGGADVLIDTSSLSPHDLKAQIGSWFGPEGSTGMSVSIESFSYKRGTPSGLDMVVDCRFLRNPHWEAALRPLDGRDPPVGAYIRQDPRYSQFHDKLTGLVEFLLPAYREEGKAYFSLGLGCTGGRHRSVYMVYMVAKRLAEQGWRVSIRHRELEREDRVAPAKSERQIPL
ncbi:MAG: RNase adapter RapZ [Pseudomonadota bacterium]